MKTTTLSLLTAQFTYTKHILQKIGSGQIIESIRKIISSPKSNHSNHPQVSYFEKTPQQVPRYPHRRNMTEIMVPKSAKLRDFQTPNRTKSRNVHKVRHSTQFNSPSRSLQTISSFHQSPLKIVRGIFTNPKNGLSYSKMPTLDTSQISTVCDNLFEMGTKRSSTIFNGRVINFWD